MVATGQSPPYTISKKNSKFIYLLIVFQNPYTGPRPMDIGTVNE